ncbi:MAG: hypothetical protein WBO10_01960 [Pyrinomonadaceae bacterium]
MSSEKNNVPDALLQELQDIYWDDANDQKTESAREAIQKHIKDLSSEASAKEGEALAKEGYTLVKVTDLKWMRDKVKEGNQFKVDAENEIGWVLANLHTIKDKLNFKTLTKLMAGQLDLKTLGIDMDRLEAIGKKFAPNTLNQIADQTKKQLSNG